MKVLQNIVMTLDFIAYYISMFEKGRDGTS